MLVAAESHGLAGQVAASALMLIGTAGSFPYRHTGNKQGETCKRSASAASERCNTVVEIIFNMIGGGVLIFPPSNCSFFIPRDLIKP